MELSSETLLYWMIRFRNLIVHEYEQIDPDVMYSLISSRLDDFARFRDELDRTFGSTE
jgi:uncharacterized protein YutE (UPF0331/DUF86 family)